MSDYRAALEAYILREAKPVEKFGHQPRLSALATLVGQGQEYDEDVLYAAAWLHDLGVFTGHRPEEPQALARWDNVAYAMTHAPGVLRSCGFPLEKIPAVVEAIRTHQPSAEPATIEGAILRDADILEQLGAIGILRTVCKIGRDTRYTTFTSAVEKLRHDLATLPAKLRFDTSRILSDQKIGAMRVFLQGIEQENYGALF